MPKIYTIVSIHTIFNTQSLFLHLKGVIHIINIWWTIVLKWFIAELQTINLVTGTIARASSVRSYCTLPLVYDYSLGLMDFLMAIHGVDPNQAILIYNRWVVPVVWLTWPFQISYMDLYVWWSRSATFSWPGDDTNLLYTWTWWTNVSYFIKYFHIILYSYLKYTSSW